MHGYRVLRFWNHDVLKNIDGVMETIIDAVASIPPTPDPSPPQERGEGKASRGDPLTPYHSVAR